MGRWRRQRGRQKDWGEVSNWGRNGETVGIPELEPRSPERAECGEPTRESAPAFRARGMLRSTAIALHTKGETLGG